MAGLNLGGLRPGATQAAPSQQKPPVSNQVENKPVVDESALIAKSGLAEDFRADLEADSDVTYSVYPLDKFSIGSTWNFEKGVLTVNRTESLRIDEFLANSDHATRNLVKKIDRRIADAIVRNLRPVATKNFDSAVFTEGRQQTEVGTEDIAAQMNRDAGE